MWWWSRDQRVLSLNLIPQNDESIDLYILPRAVVFLHYRSFFYQNWCIISEFDYYHSGVEGRTKMFQNGLISLVFWWQDKSYSGQNLRSILSLVGTFFFTTRTVFPISIQWGFSFVKPRGLISNQPLLLKRTQSPGVALAWFRIKMCRVPLSLWSELSYFAPKISYLFFYRRLIYCSICKLGSFLDWKWEKIKILQNSLMQFKLSWLFSQKKPQIFFGQFHTKSATVLSIVKLQRFSKRCRHYTHFVLFYFLQRWINNLWKICVFLSEKSWKIKVW